MSDANMIFASYIFLIGLITGSFLNVLIYRLPRGEPLVKGRSRCPDCGKSIRWYDNIPLVSYVVLRARCRDCGARISLRYPAVELLCALLFLGVFYMEQTKTADILTPQSLFSLIAYLYFAAVMIAVSYIDSDRHIIPDKITYPSFIVGIVLLLAADPYNWLNMLVGAIFGGGFLLIVFLVAPLIFKKQGMGFGDVKFGAVLGVFLGVHVVLALLLSSLIGTLYGAIMIASRKLKWQERFAFGPCLAIAALITYFAGQPIIDWYLGLFT